jgi:hypothetical protein
MVEVHLVRSEGPAAIGARPGAQLSKQLHRPMLADTDALDLEVPVSGVVRPVRRSLAASTHAEY